MKTLEQLILAAVISVAPLATLNAQDTGDPVLDMKLKIVEMQNAGQTSYHNLSICDAVTGYGAFTKNEGNVIKKNTAIIIYYEPRNLYTALKDGIYSMSYTQDLILLTADESRELFRQNEMLKFNNSSTLPVLDVYATNELTLDGLPPGTYIVKGVMRDKLRPNAQEIEWKLKFTVAE